MKVKSVDAEPQEWQIYLERLIGLPIDQAELELEAKGFRYVASPRANSRAYQRPRKTVYVVLALESP